LKALLFAVRSALSSFEVGLSGVQISGLQITFLFPPSSQWTAASFGDDPVAILTTRVAAAIR
jgi:hypothetical protein